MRGYCEIREYRARVSDKDWRIVSHVRDTDASCASSGHFRQSVGRSSGIVD